LHIGMDRKFVCSWPDPIAEVKLYLRWSLDLLNKLLVF